MRRRHDAGQELAHLTQLAGPRDELVFWHFELQYTRSATLVAVRDGDSRTCHGFDRDHPAQRIAWLPGRIGVSDGGGPREPLSEHLRMEAKRKRWNGGRHRGQLAA
eukprot:1230380-Prymnesium_polylepis.1